MSVELNAEAHMHKIRSYIQNAFECDLEREFFDRRFAGEYTNMHYAKVSSIIVDIILYHRENPPPASSLKNIFFPNYSMVVDKCESSMRLTKAIRCIEKGINTMINDAHLQWKYERLAEHNMGAARKLVRESVAAQLCPGGYLCAVMVILRRVMIKKLSIYTKTGVSL